MLNQFKKVLPGILLCLIISIPAWILGKLFPIIGGSVFGILFGILIVSLFPNLQSKFNFKYGITYTSKKLLQYSIILLGFDMNLFNVIRVGGQSLFVILFTLTAAFVTAYFVGKALNIRSKVVTLIGVGTSICGGSAIAATAPVIKAESEDVAHSISTIFLFNIIAVFIFPALGHALHMSDIGFGMWAGTAINDTSSVVAAGSSWSAVAGNNTALAFATIVKLTRTLMIVPITLFLAIYTSKKSSGIIDGQQQNFKFSKVFPWFILGFIATAIINTIANGQLTITHDLVTIGKFFIVMAMTSIGLNTHIKKLISNGFKPIFLGLCCWFAVAGVSLLVQIIMKLW